MTNAGSPAENGVRQIVDAEGQVVATSSAWFPEDTDLGSEALTIVAILGAQSSGKSTLLNEVLGTKFSVGSRGTVGKATTKGIAAAKAAQSSVMVALDIEGSDSRERGKNGASFQSKCAAFAASVADIIFLNIWYHDVGRLSAVGYSILEAVFAEAGKEAASDPDCFRTALVFVVRDIEDDANVDDLTDLLVQDAGELWSSETRTSGVSLDVLFDISVAALPHMRHRPTEFKNECSELSSRLLDSSCPDFLAKTIYSKSIPADGCGTFALGLWENMFAGADAHADAGEVGDLSAEPLLAAFRCNEAFSNTLQEATSKLTEYTRMLDEGEKIDGFGAKAADIMNNALLKYDEATAEFRDESIQARKRRELESIIDTSQQALFMRQMQLLRENALVHFKSATTSEDMPSDFAFYTADSLFQREADDAKRPGSSWSSTQERSDLQNMMQEISTQRKRLLTSQVSAAQQQAHAMQFLQMQQSQMNAIQAQAYGGGGVGQWNLGAAYRPPDTNINASLSYQQGRTNIQISMVPDDSASLLGPNGFTAGVGPGNLGLSFNIGL